MHTVKTYRILLNPGAGNGRGEAEAQKLRGLLTDGELIFRNITEIKHYAAFFSALGAEDTLVIAGGDGTLNRFVNATEGLTCPVPVWYYATGSGNDFWCDLGRKKGDPPVCIDPYLQNLPTVEVKGKRYRVLNGVGYGIDGYCCEVGDKLRARSVRKINYTSIAIKGLLFHFRPVSATVTVDGVAHSCRKVWLAPTMNGRFYGGGMMPAPDQDRLNADGTVSVMVMNRTGKLRTLMLFPSIFSGGHVRHESAVHVWVGHEIKVQFDRPTPLQIDGETISDVTEYTMCGRLVPVQETTKSAEGE